MNYYGFMSFGIIIHIFIVLYRYTDIYNQLQNFSFSSHCLLVAFRVDTLEAAKIIKEKQLLQVHSSRLVLLLHNLILHLFLVWHSYGL